MNVKDFVSVLSNELQSIRSSGVSEIKIENLIKYLNSVSAAGDSSSEVAALEKYKAELQVWVEARKANLASDLEMFRSVISSGQNALRSSFLMNGGAVVALLAFLGRLAELDKADKVQSLSNALIYFVGGVFAITLATAFTYYTQFFYARSKTELFGHFFLVITSLLGFVSYGLFIYGSYLSYLTFYSF